METLLGIGSFVFVIAIITFSRYMRTHDEGQSETSTTMDNEKGEIKPDTIGLMYNTLNALGCQPVKMPGRWRLKRSVVL